jgi:hypothetical protein
LGDFLVWYMFQAQGDSGAASLSKRVESRPQPRIITSACDREMCLDIAGQGREGG